MTSKILRFANVPAARVHTTGTLHNTYLVVSLTTHEQPGKLELWPKYANNG